MPFSEFTHAAAIVYCCNNTKETIQEDLHDLVLLHRGFHPSGTRIGCVLDSTKPKNFCLILSKRLTMPDCARYRSMLGHFPDLPGCQDVTEMYSRHVPLCIQIPTSYIRFSLYRPSTETEVFPRSSAPSNQAVPSFEDMEAPFQEFGLLRISSRSLTISF